MAELADGAVQASATSNSDAPLQESLDLSGPTLSWADDRHPSRHLLRFLKVWWRTLVVVLTPLLLLPIPLALGDHASRAAYVIAIVAVYWVTEAVPLAVTALLPLVLFPVVGVLTARETARSYLNDTNMLFVGGLMVAVAIEKHCLHKRIAFLVLMAVGSRPRWLLLGFMSTTAFLSMWISNTATAAMMLPIAHAVLEEVREEPVPDRGSVREGGSNGRVSTHLELSTMGTSEGGGGDEEVEDLETEVDSETTVLTIRGDGEGSGNGTDGGVNEPSPVEMDGGFRRLAKVLMLGVAYSANIGGTATLTGTGPNLVLSGDVSSLFPASPGVNFGLWFAFAFPVMLLALFCSWLYLSLLYCDDSFQWLKRRLWRRRRMYSLQVGRARGIIREQYKKLGPIRYAEVVVLILFSLLAFLWLLREPRFIPGWGSWFPTDPNGRSYVSDSTIALFIVFLLFVLPSKPLFTWRKQSGLSWRCGCLGAGSSPRLLDWDTVQHKLPWNVVLLLGSGYALATGAQSSCLSVWIGSRLLGLQTLPRAAIALCVSAIVASVTEVISNVATTSLFLPVLAQLAVDLHINPLYLMIPAALSASFAFMLPVATPPNAIAFSYGYIRVVDMVVTGIFMNVLCVLVVALALNTTGVPIFGLGTFPEWANTSSLAIDSLCLQTWEVNR